MPKTDWRIVSRNPAYEISPSGIVRRRLPGRGSWVGRRLAQCDNGTGYIYVNIGTRAYVHILLCEAYHGPRPKGCEAGHKNDRRGDNRRGNVEWQTVSDNRRQTYAHGRKRPRSRPPFLTPRQVATIRRLGARGIKHHLIAARFGTCRPHVCMIINGQRWGDKR